MRRNRDGAAWRKAQKVAEVVGPLLLQRVLALANAGSAINITHSRFLIVVPQSGCSWVDAINDVNTSG